MFLILQTEAVGSGSVMLAHNPEHRVVPNDGKSKCTGLVFSAVVLEIVPTFAQKGDGSRAQGQVQFLLIL